MKDKIWPDVDADLTYNKIKLKSNRPKGGWINGVYILKGDIRYSESDKFPNVRCYLPDGEDVFEH